MSSGGWTKLFGSIVTSSVWCEDDKTLRVWVAMLATADADGVVEGSIPGFANLARVEPPDLRTAIARLSAPDPDSRTTDHEGRRIESIPGGWRVLNYSSYRSRGQAKEGSRAPYYRAYRAGKRESVAQHCAQQRSVARNTEAEAEAEAEAVHPVPAAPVLDLAPTEPQNGKGAVKPAALVVAEVVTLRPRQQRSGGNGNGSGPETWLSPYMDAWTSRYGGTAPAKRLAHALRPLELRHGAAVVLAGWRAYLEATAASYATPERFASTIGTWVASAAGISERSLQNEGVLQEFMNG